MEFKPGDKVRGSVDQFYYREDADWTAEILSGPHDMAGIGGDVYLVKYTGGGAVDTGKTDTVHSRFLVAESAEPPTDPRVDVAAKAVAKHAGESDWERTPTYVQEESRAIASVVLAAMDAMPDDKPAPAPLAVGDRIRILKDRLLGASVTAGEVYEVSHVDSPAEFRVKAHQGARQGVWYFNQRHEGIGYERVTDDGPAHVRDHDGDVWEKQPDGTWTCTSTGGDADYRGLSWERLSRHFGPLTPLES